MPATNFPSSASLSRKRLRHPRLKAVKLMKAKEIVNLSDAELSAKLQELKTELFNLRFRHASGQLDNPLSINLVKKDIARVNTVMRARQLKG